jgi:hypothetical protein
MLVDDRDGRVLLEIPDPPDLADAICRCAPVLARQYRDDSRLRTLT